MRSQPLSVRSRVTAAGPDEALVTRYDPFEPLELCTSDLRDDYLAGRIMLVANDFKANGRTIHLSYSIVPAALGDRGFYASIHREKTLAQLQQLYRNAVMRAIPHNNPKTLKRRRARMNKAFGTDAPCFDETDTYCSAWPDALAAGAPFRQMAIDWGLSR